MNFKIKILPTVADGSCLIHAVLQAFNKSYNQLKTDCEKSKLVKEVRFHLAKVLEFEFPDKKKFYQKLSRGELESLSEALPEAKIEYMQQYLNSDNFLTLQYIEMISEVFNLNIIFYSQKEKDFYKHGDNELLFKKNRETVFINYIDQCHYETICIDNKTLFKPGDKVVKKAIKKLNV